MVRVGREEEKKRRTRKCKKEKERGEWDVRPKKWCSRNYSIFSFCWFACDCEVFHWRSSQQSQPCPFSLQLSFISFYSIDLYVLFLPLSHPVDHSRLCFLSLIPQPSLPLFLLPCTTSPAHLLSLYLAISRTLPIILLLTGKKSLRLIFSFSLGICASQHLAWPIDLPPAMDQSVYRCISFLQTLIHGRGPRCVWEGFVWRTHRLILSWCSQST